MNPLGRIYSGKVHFRRPTQLFGAANHVADQIAANPKQWVSERAPQETGIKLLFSPNPRKHKIPSQVSRPIVKPNGVAMIGIWYNRRQAGKGVPCIASIVSLSYVLLFYGSGNTRADDVNVIGHIDTYGLCEVTQDAILKAAGLKPGDPAPDATKKEEIVRKLQALPGVKQAAVSVIRGALLEANAIGAVVYIGIDEGGRRRPALRALPISDTMLPDDIVRASEDFDSAFASAMRRGSFGEDQSRGYSLMKDEQARRVQERFVALAAQHGEALAKVLRHSKNVNHRRIAAMVIGYSSDKRAAARELLAASRDPDRGVRNNAMLALSALIHYAASHDELNLELPADEFVEMLDSLDWTDRNKAMAVLLELTSDGDEAVLAKLREKALPTLAEMARWKSTGHAMMAHLLLCRAAGISDEDAAEGWFLGERESAIARALDQASQK